MDLVEIRKKAKKLKESKGKAKEEATDSGAEVVPAPDLLEKQEASEKKEAPAVHVEEVIEAAPPTGEGPETKAEGEEADLSLLSGEAATEDFLSGVLNTLYEESAELEDEEEEDEDIEEFLCFKLSDEEYAVDIHNVREIIKMMDITEVPKTPEFMLGIISLRGVIIPLLDLRMRLSLEVTDYTPRTRIIIASSGEIKMGMVVDAVTEVVRLKKGVMEAPPSMLTSIDADLLKGVGRHDDRLLIIPNLAKVFDVGI